MFAVTPEVDNVVVFPTEVTSPERLALVVTVAAFPPIFKLAAVPVILVPTKAEGVPKAGVTSVGEVDNTTPPVPVEAAVDPVPPLATGRVPLNAVAAAAACQVGNPSALAVNTCPEVPSTFG